MSITSPEIQAAREALLAARRATFIAGIRKLADLLEDNPNIALPYNLYATVYVSVDQAREIRHGIPGWRKDAGNKNQSSISYTLNLTPELEAWEGVVYCAQVPKSDTCKRVQVDSRHVEAHDEPIYEWECE